MHFRPFEIVLIGIFGLFAIGGLVFLSFYKGGDSSEMMIYGEKVVIWGTFKQNVVEQVFNTIATADKPFSVVTYRQVDERSFENELLNAIADGNAPDLIMLPHTLLITYRSKLYQIPQTSLDVRTLRDTYIDGAEIFMQNDGAYAIPFAVDPLVLFWNRDLFANAGLSLPPKTWQILVQQSTPALTRMNDSKTILQSAIGMGEYMNINHAKEILSMLFFQSGTSVVEIEKDHYAITLAKSMERGTPPAQAALSFYTQFASPGSNTFTWTRSLQADRNAFTAGNLAMYFGFGSEIPNLEVENPNLNFDIAPVPQEQGATALRTYGTFYGYAIPKASRNADGALRVALVLSEKVTASTMSSALHLTPVHRGSTANPSGDAYGEVLRQSALIARGWLDPSPRDTDELFKTMIESITLGRGTAAEVVSDASYTLESLFR